MSARSGATIGAVQLQAGQRYTRAQVCRIAGVSHRQLRAWEKQGLIRAVSEYSFADLLALRTLAQLRRHKIPLKQIRQAILSLREKWAQVENPLAELRLFPEGRRLKVQLDGTTLEPITGQLGLPFGQGTAVTAAGDDSRLIEFPQKVVDALFRKQERERQHLVESLFARAVELEQQGRVSEALRYYRDVLELNPQHAPTLVNLGTICFYSRDLRAARQYYEEAVRAAPDYPLAHFNLGNLLDELGQLEAALREYQEALRLKPDYADAHFNIALVYRALGQPLQAISHFRQYLRLDPASEWARAARRELERLYREMVLHPVSSA